MRIYNIVRVLLFIIAQIISAAARLSEPACFANSCIYIDQAGTVCFKPDPYTNASTTCDGGPLGATIFAPFIQAHIAQSLSIAYYRPDFILLGGAAWPLPAPSQRPEPIVLCMSGRTPGVVFGATRCRFTAGDNDMEDLIAEEIACVVQLAQAVVSDGCYIPVVQGSPSPSARPASSTTGLSTPSNSVCTADPLATSRLIRGVPGMPCTPSAAPTSSSVGSSSRVTTIVPIIGTILGAILTVLTIVFLCRKNVACLRKWFPPPPEDTEGIALADMGNVPHPPPAANGGPVGL